jgi:DNA-binding NarL/FixJ family response regulator
MKKNLRILLVDDHVTAIASLAIILKQEGDMEVVGEASNGQMAVDLTKDLHPDVVIMDVRMPVLNGIEATKRILAHHPHVKIIGFTMNSEDNVAEAMQNAGAVACVSKSDSIENLLAIIRHCHPA